MSSIRTKMSDRMKRRQPLPCRLVQFGTDKIKS
uniref:Uncharacterized protein n=1 Tax=viral metagenome TaxID=1070528 RepID=A0A6C0J210_9ZZZZ